MVREEAEKGLKMPIENRKEKIIQNAQIKEHHG